MDAEEELLVGRGQALIAISVTSTVLAIGTCGVRFVARRHAKRGLWWDDYSVIVAMVMGFVALIFASIEATSVQDPTRALQFTYLARPWLMLGTTLAKISVCFFLLRTLGRRRPWNICLGILILLLTLVNLAFALASNLMCRPLEKLWEPEVEGECFGMQAELGITYFQGGFAVFVFFFLAIFPVFIVRDLVLLKSVRWPFYVLSASMFLSGVFCVMRTYQVSEIRGRGTFDGAVILATLFDVLTQNLAITAANMLPLGTIISAPNMRSLSSLAPTALTDLEAYSRPSSPRSAKASTIFVIEGPREDIEHPLPSRPGTAHVRSESHSRPSTANLRPELHSSPSPGHLRSESHTRSIRSESHSRPSTGHLRSVSQSRSVRSVRSESHSRPSTAHSRYTSDRPFTGMSLRPDTATGMGRSGTEISAGGPLPSGVDSGLLREGIVRTVEVAVVEETVDDFVRDEVSVGNWTDILREGPQ